MADIRLARENFVSPARNRPVSERKVVIAILLLDGLLAAIVAAVTIENVFDFKTRPVLGTALMTILALAMTLRLWSRNPQDLISEALTARFRTLLTIVVYANLFGLLMGEVWPEAYATVKAFLLITPLVLLIHHLAWRVMLGSLERAGYLRRKAIVLLFTGSFSGSRGSLGILRSRYRVVGEFSLNAEPPIELVQRALRFADRFEAQELFLIETNERASGPVLELLGRSPLPVYLVPSSLVAGCVGSRNKRIGAEVVFEIRRTALNAAEQRLKRLTDVVVAAIGLILVSPILLCAAVLIRCDSPGPIIYRQSRLGLLGQSFQILKFRTMHIRQDDSQIKQATKGDPRVTRVGRWLRLTSIDELPQLLNVLKGDMSIVGPRPHAVSHDMYYSERIPNYLLRQRVRPGLTGWAQANYHRGETQTLEKMAQRVNLDLWYIDHWGPTLDLAIMLRTAVHLFRFGDAY